MSFAVMCQLLDGRVHHLQGKSHSESRLLTLSGTIFSCLYQASVWRLLAFCRASTVQCIHRYSRGMSLAPAMVEGSVAKACRGACLWLDCLQAILDDATRYIDAINLQEVFPCMLALPDKECWRSALATCAPACGTNSLSTYRAHNIVISSTHRSGSECIDKSLLDAVTGPRHGLLQAHIECRRMLTEPLSIVLAARRSEIVPCMFIGLSPGSWCPQRYSRGFEGGSP